MNKNFKLIFYAIVILIISVLTYVMFFRPFYLTTVYIHSEKYLRMAEGLKEIEIKDSSVLFIGNSLMVDFKTSSSSENAVKWAIRGDVLSGLQWRLEALKDKNPQAIIINLGINDIINGFGFSPEKLEHFILNFKESLPRSELYIMSLSPESLSPGTFTSPKKIAFEIKEANKQIENLCSTYSLTFIDVYSGLESNGKLISDYTTDGLHLTQEGYNVWEKEIIKTIGLTP